MEYVKLTCGDCQHFERCVWLLQRKSEDKPCDFIPWKFKLRKEERHDDTTERHTEF